MCADMIQVYIVTAYLLAYSYLKQNDLCPASYTIIISVLLLHCYYIYMYIYIYIYIFVARVLPTTTKPGY